MHLCQHMFDGNHVGIFDGEMELPVNLHSLETQVVAAAFVLKELGYDLQHRLEMDSSLVFTRLWNYHHVVVDILSGQGDEGE